MIVALLLAIALPQETKGTHHEAACPPTAAPLPPEMEGWARPSRAQAGSSAVKATSLELGTAVAATLLPTPAITYVVRPEKPAAPVSKGGVFAVTIAEPGWYRVALGSAAWVDVLNATTPVKSVAHRHGPACSTIRKIVDFDLKPGRYVLQIAGNGSATLPLMVSRVL